MEHSEVVSKVQKLLALSNSANEHEAALAASRARDLLSKYNLDMAECLAREEEIDLKAVEEQIKDKEVAWAGNLFGGVARIFDCHPIRGGGLFRFVGMTADVQTAVYTYQFLCREIERLGTQAMPMLKAQNRGESPRRLGSSYRMGMVSRILRDMREQSPKRKAEQEGCTALVVIKKAGIQDYINDAYPNLRRGRPTRSYVSNGAYERGYADGANVSVRPGVGAGSGQRRIA